MPGTPTPLNPVPSPAGAKSFEALLGDCIEAFRNFHVSKQPLSTRVCKFLSPARRVLSVYVLTCPSTFDNQPIYKQRWLSGLRKSSQGRTNQGRRGYRNLRGSVLLTRHVAFDLASSRLACRSQHA